MTADAVVVAIVVAAVARAAAAGRSHPVAGRSPVAVAAIPAIAQAAADTRHLVATAAANQAARLHPGTVIQMTRGSVRSDDAVIPSSSLSRCGT